MSPFVLAQWGMTGDSWWSWIVWIVIMAVFFMFYPRMMTSQIMWKLEKAAQELESLSAKSRQIILKEISAKPTKPIKDSVDRFFEFFVITPVSLDPAGIVHKLEHILIEQESRFRLFVEQVAPKADKERQANLQMGMAGGITLYTIAKIVRHYVELVRKTKSIQIAMILQMQMPMIVRIAKAVFKGTQTLVKGNPIGDGIGPLAVAEMIGTKKTREVARDVLMARAKMHGRDIFLVKAKGPGGRIGRPGKAVDTLVRKNKISRIITIDAAAKLEGEKTGSIAEGVGVAMGGPGVERTYIENIAVQKGIPLDSIIVKMGQEEAIMPLRKVVKDSLPEVNEAVKRSLERSKKGQKVIIVGVGNTSGVGNSSKDAKKTFEWVNKYEKLVKLKKKAKKGKEGFI
jgi:hypothetical protein